MLSIYKEFLVCPPLPPLLDLIHTQPLTPQNSLFPLPNQPTHQNKQRAHTIFARAFAPTEKSDALPHHTDPRKLLSLLIETAEPPPYSAAAREALSKALGIAAGAAGLGASGRDAGSLGLGGLGLGLGLSAIVDDAEELTSFNF